MADPVKKKYRLVREKPGSGGAHSGAFVHKVIETDEINPSALPPGATEVPSATPVTDGWQDGKGDGSEGKGKA